MPDIDIDFEDTRREKVIQYVQQKYGELHVSGIVTFGHLLARAVARDVGRIMGFDEITLNEISSLIPHKLGITLNEAYQIEDFKSLYIVIIDMKNGLIFVKIRRAPKAYFNACSRYHY